MGFFSSDDTEFIRRFPDEAITHGFSRRRPGRSVQIPPEVGKSPTDFTDIHRFFLGRFFCHADFADDADFFSWDFFHRMTRNLFGGIPAETITHGFSRRRPGRSVQIPPGIGICPTKKNLCISVKSVGQNNPHKEKSASSAKSVGRNNPPQRKICVYLRNLWDEIISTKKNLCISVKSVGRNNPHKEESASSAKSA